jgi:hypothetical protein
MRSQPEFTVARHPDAKLKSSVFKYAVFRNGELFEGFRTASAAEGAAEEYNQPHAVHEQ